MNNGKTPLGMATAFSFLTFFISIALFLMIPALPDYFAPAFGETRFLLPPLLLSLLVGFLIWLNLTLSVHRSMISELKFQIRALEENLDNTKKD